MALRPATAYVAGVITALVVGTGTAYAASGGTFLIGRANTATTLTYLTNTEGSSIYLRSKLGDPPFLVNRTTKVPNLNADSVDGVDSSQLALAAPRIGTIVAYGTAIENNSNHPGPDQIAAIATCPAGSQLVGGGGLDPTGANLYWDTPGEGNTWQVVSSSTDYAHAIDVEAHARCWNPRADVPDSQGVTPTTALRTTSGKAMLRSLRTAQAR